MTMTRRPLAAALALVLLAALPATAAKKDKFAPVYQQMDAASQTYRAARLRLQSGDDTAMAQLSKSLEDLEELARQCLRQKGCDATRVITQYETLLKSADLGPQDALAGESDWNDHAEPDHLHLAAGSPVLAASPEAARSVAMLNDGHAFDRMVEMNPQIQAAMREWLTSQRAFLIDAWENYQYMRYLMAPEYEKSGLPEALLFGIMAKESGGKVHAISRAGATGPLQFMPATGYRFGLGRDASGFDSRFDPKASARANAAYINERFRELNRNLEYTIAAYNGGEGRAARLYQANAGASLWTPQVNAQLPVETRDYVPAVIAAAWLFLHPKKYGLEFPKLDTTPAQFTVARQTSINELTICLGNGGSRDGWFRVLRNLNPRYESTSPIVAGTVLRAPKKVAALYTRNCVSGNRASLAAELINANKAPAYAVAETTAPAVPVAAVEKPKPDRKRKPDVYRVRAGDSLAAIAREHDCDVSTLARQNKLKKPSYMIKPGQRLKLDGCG
jgi:membrane-bound lytic murein transglycosylase D